MAFQMLLLVCVDDLKEWQALQEFTETLLPQHCFAGSGTNTSMRMMSALNPNRIWPRLTVKISERAKRMSDIRSRGLSGGDQDDNVASRKAGSCQGADAEGMCLVLVMASFPRSLHYLSPTALAVASSSETSCCRGKPVPGMLRGNAPRQRRNYCADRSSLASLQETSCAFRRATNGMLLVFDGRDSGGTLLRLWPAGWSVCIKEFLVGPERPSSPSDDQFRLLVVPPNQACQAFEVSRWQDLRSRQWTSDDFRQVRSTLFCFQTSLFLIPRRLRWPKYGGSL